MKEYTVLSGDNTVALSMGISRSTIHGWNNTDFSKYIGNISDFKSDVDLCKINHQKEKLKYFLKKCFIISEGIHNIYNRVIEKKEQVLHKSKDYILNFIDNFKGSLNISQILNFFRISEKQYHVWINDKDCPESLEKRCRQVYTQSLFRKRLKT